jgi:hypothetical protein
MNRRVGPWSKLTDTRYQAFQDSAPEIKRWRTEEHKAGRPSGLEDFFRAHGLCFACKTTGTRLSPVGWDGETPLYEQCPVCGGTGTLPVS